MSLESQSTCLVFEGLIGRMQECQSVVESSKKVGYMDITSGGLISNNRPTTVCW